MLLPIHIAAGGLAIVLGAVALSVKKGGTIHRGSGLLFVCAMLVLGVSAAILGVRKGATGNVFSGLTTAYFVITALTAVSPESQGTRRITVVALVVATGLAFLDIVAGVEAFNSPGGWRNGAPFQMLFFLATVMILAAAGDLRVVRFGMPRGGPRLARHLW
jgi:asparagine N-glycosylation enzyme membrane subunit Stt3